VSPIASIIMRRGVLSNLLRTRLGIMILGMPFNQIATGQEHEFTQVRLSIR